MTVEADVPADEVVVTVSAPNADSRDLVTRLRDAGIPSRAATEFMIHPMIEGAQVVVERPERRAVDETVRRIRAALGDVGGIRTDARPHLRSCDTAENLLRRAAFAELDAPHARDVLLGQALVTDGSCGALGYFTGSPSSSLTVTARMTVGIVL